MQYFIKRGDKVQGPFSREQLLSFANAKKVIGTDQVGNTQQGPFQEFSSVWESMKTQDVSIGVSLETPEPSINPNLSACVDCGGIVSKRATACPHCGAPIQTAEQLVDTQSGNEGLVEVAPIPVSEQQYAQQQYAQQQYPQQQYPQQQYPQQQHPQQKEIVEKASMKNPLNWGLVGIIANKYSPQIAWSGILFVSAIFCVIYCLFFVDTSVSTGFGRVHNIGKMQQNQNLLMVSAFVAVGSGAWLGFEINRWKKSQ